MWIAGVLPEAAMRDDITRDYIEKMAPHSTTEVKLPKIRKDYICDLSKIHIQGKIGGSEERIFYIYKYPSITVPYIIQMKCNTYNKLIVNQSTHEIFI